MRVDGRPVHFRSSARRARRRHRHGASGASRRAGADRRRERVSRRAAGEPVGHRRLAAAWRAGAASSSRSLGLDIDPRARLGDFPIGVQQLVELSRVLFSGARIIILDEPTSALSPPEIERLFGVLRGCATEAAASSSSRISSTTFSRSRTRSRSSATAGRSRPRRGHAGDRQGLDHRADDRHWAARNSRRAISARSSSTAARRRRSCSRRRT